MSDENKLSVYDKIAHVADVVLSLARTRVVWLLLAFALVLLALALAILAWKV